MFQGWWMVAAAAMTGGGRCQQRRRNMLQGEEKPCAISVPRVSESGIAEKPSKFDKITELPLQQNEIDFYTQARKALCQRCPFDTEDSPTTTSTTQSQATTVHHSLPNSLAQLLNKHSDSRKRHKKSHGGTETKKKSSSSRQKGGRNSGFWDEVEEYFRELTVEDIDRLYKLGSFELDQELLSSPTTFDTVSCDRGVSVKEVEEKEQLMEVDSEGGRETELGNNKEEKDENVKPCSSPPFSGLEWLLGSRSKVYLASERPSKKRKLLGGDAGLEKLLVARPVEGSASFCHYCSLGDSGDVLNRLIVCSSCSMIVHQRCYGVQDDDDGTWSCSRCKKKNEMMVNNDRPPCVLCPKSGGALKPCKKRGLGNEESSGLDFAHLFCSQWMPEVFIENTRIMEPIMNIDGIKDTRKKLICYLCKLKHGACVRCSNGACRTSFHPICAREASHRMEIWGKLGCDDVELRAFCLKHSELQSNFCSQQVGGAAVDVSCSTDNSQLVASVTAKPHKLKAGLRNGDKTVLCMDNAISGVDKKLNDDALQQEVEKGLNSKGQTECSIPQQPLNKDLSENKDGDVVESLNLTILLKKLIEQKKVDVKDVAAEIGVSSDLLASTLNLQDDPMAPDMWFKVAKWLRNHAYVSSLQKTLKVKIKSAMAPKVEADVVDDFSIRVTEPETADFVPVKSVPPRRRTKNNVKVVKDDESLYSSKEILNIDGVAVDEAKPTVIGRDGSSCPTEFPSAGLQKVILETIPSKTTLVVDSNNDEEPSKVSMHSLLDNGQPEQAALSDLNLVKIADTRSTVSSLSSNHLPDVLKREAFHSSDSHPLVQSRLRQMESGVPLDDFRNGEVSQVEASSSSGICCSQHSQQSITADSCKFNGACLEQLVKASNMGLLELSPADEVEGELVYYQQRLLCNAAARKRFSDDLIVKVVDSLQQETDAARQREWDAVLVSQYLYELREAKKQGRKEKRHKEAQTVLAAATAAAAASSRSSSLRKDNIEESMHQEMNATNERLRLSSQLYPRVKETLSRPAGVRILPETNSDLVQLGSGFTKDHARICDVCRRPETILNPILVCTGCKVAVHLDCYRSVRNSTGPWYCELCEELLSSGGSGAQASYLLEKEKPCFVAECGLCGGTAGAFRKSNDGQWVHAFCAEWVFESTFRRGQVHPIEGMASAPKGNDVCLVCQRRKGVCTKCSYGHCQSTIHPSCARSAGFFLSMRTNGGRLQHKAYCDKHSVEQRLKSETHRHGVEELKSLKQVRVELERLRLLCERIVKREKLKREVILCSHDILASSRDNAVLSALTRHPYFQPDVSSDSATTTSVKGYTDGCKSGSETIQRSDDITVDSAVAGKRRIKFPVSMDNDRKTDDSSTSPNPVTHKPAQRVSLSGKQIPYRASCNSTEHGDKRLRYTQHMETFEKEVVMTSDQASMKNQRLPKGYVYVPIRCLPKEEEPEEAARDECSGEPLEPDG